MFPLNARPSEIAGNIGFFIVMSSLNMFIFCNQQNIAYMIWFNSDVFTFDEKQSVKTGKAARSTILGFQILIMGFFSASQK